MNKIKPIEKKYHNKDLNIAYAQGQADERAKVLKLLKDEHNSRDDIIKELGK